MQSNVQIRKQKVNFLHKQCISHVQNKEENFSNKLLFRAMSLICSPLSPTFWPSKESEPYSISHDKFTYFSLKVNSTYQFFQGGACSFEKFLQSFIYLVVSKTFAMFNFLIVSKTFAKFLFSRNI